MGIKATDTSCIISRGLQQQQINPLWEVRVALLDKISVDNPVVTVAPRRMGGGWGWGLGVGIAQVVRVPDS